MLQGLLVNIIIYIPTHKHMHPRATRSQTAMLGGLGKGLKNKKTINDYNLKGDHC